MENGPDRQRELALDCLEISVISRRPMPLVFGIPLRRVSISQGGSVAPDTSNYRTPNGKTGAIDSGNWNATVWKYQLCLLAPCH